MQRYMTSVVIIALVLVGATLLLSSDFFKKGITGSAIDSGYVCGSYSFIFPVSAVASSTSSSVYTPSNAIDNINSTSWLSSKTTSSWIYFDLGTKRCANQVRLYLDGSYVPLTLNIQTSNDAQNWKTVSSAWTISTGNTYVDRSFPAESARYVKLVFTSGQGSQTSTGTAPTTFYGNVGEIKVNAAQLILVSGTGSGVSGSGVGGTGGAGGGAGDTAGGAGGGAGGRGGRTTTSPGGAGGAQRGATEEGGEEEGGGLGKILIGEKSRKSTLIIVFIIILLLIALALAIAFYYNKKKQEGRAGVFGQKMMR